MLDQITPVILTCNEAPNISRTLSRLTWAKRVVIVDSFSTDDTCDLARAHPNVEVLQRTFDDHRNQWTFAVHQTGIATPWVLALDADYVLTPELVAEIATLHPDESTSGFRMHFKYCVGGRPLRGALYPPVVALYRPNRTSYVQDGHTQRLVVHQGCVADLRCHALHDDRKPLARWVRAQAKYAKLEADKLKATKWRDLGWGERLRRIPLASPPIGFFYYLVAQRCALDGKAGLAYASQRAAAELLVSLFLLEGDGADGQPRKRDSGLPELGNPSRIARAKSCIDHDLGPP